MEFLLWVAGTVVEWLLFSLTLGYLGRKPHCHGVDWGDAGLRDEEP
jgi:hypothetical protein